MHKLKLLLTALLLTAFTTSADEVALAVWNTVPASPIKHESLMTEQEQIDFVCNVLYLEYKAPPYFDCSQIEYPEVVEAYYAYYWDGDDFIGVWYDQADRTQAVEWAGVSGWYNSENKIYINRSYADWYGWNSEWVTKTLLHELTHYIDTQYRSLGPDPQWCNTESNAWHVANTYWLYVGHPENVKHNWHTWYNCPVPGPVT